MCRGLKSISYQTVSDNDSMFWYTLLAHGTQIEVGAVRNTAAQCQTTIDKWQVDNT